MADDQLVEEALIPPTSPSSSTIECMICREAIVPPFPDWQCRGCRKIFHYTCHQRYASNYPLNGCAHCHYGERSIQSSPSAQSTATTSTSQSFPNPIPPQFQVLYAPTHNPQGNAYSQFLCVWNCMLILVIFAFPVIGYVYWIYSMIVTGGCLVVGGIALYYKGSLLFTTPQRSLCILSWTFMAGVLLEFIFSLYKSIVFSIFLAIANACLLLSLFYSHRVIRRLRPQGDLNQGLVETV